MTDANRWLDYLVAKYITKLPGLVSHWPCQTDYETGQPDPIQLEWLEPDDDIMDHALGGGRVHMQPVSYYIRFTDGGFNDGWRVSVPRYSGNLDEAVKVMLALYSYWCIEYDREDATYYIEGDGDFALVTDADNMAFALVKFILDERGIDRAIGPEFGYQRREEPHRNVAFLPLEHYRELADELMKAWRESAWLTIKRSGSGLAVCGWASSVSNTRRGT